MKTFILALITVYQKTISPDHGAFQRIFPFAKCRFYPTCSQYAREAISHEGVVRGMRKAISRVLRCGGSRGGYEPYAPR